MVMVLSATCQQYFGYIGAVSFIVGRNRSTDLNYPYQKDCTLLQKRWCHISIQHGFLGWRRCTRYNIMW